MAVVPPNLLALHQAEEEVRGQALAAVNGDKHLALQLEAVHDALDHLTVLIRMESVPGSPRHTLQLLGIRALNFIASALKVGLSGYYQVSFALIRELLETTNLVDLFLSDPTLIDVWKGADKKTLNKMFKPVTVREALKKLPEYAEQDRRPKYENLSTYASHPNYAGFMLLSGDGLPKVGPFFEQKLLKALLEDMGRLSSHLALNLSLSVETDDNDSMDVLRSKAAFLERLDAYRRSWG